MFPVISKKETGINLRRIMDQCGITTKDVQKYLGLGCVQSVYRWLDGVNMPTIDNLYALSELFQMPIDAIVRGNRSAFVSYVVDSSERKTVFRYYKKLDDPNAT